MRFAALFLVLASPSSAAFFSRPAEMRVAIPLAAMAPAPIIQSIAPLSGGGFAVNGFPAAALGFGDFKAVVMHPQSPELAVKVFRDRWTPGVAEKESELKQLALLPAAAAPRVVEHGVTDVAGRPTAYLVQERVSGLTLQNPTPMKLAEVRKLFERLTKARVEIADGKSAVKLRANIMVGETSSGGFGAYLVDPDVTRSDKSDGELRSFYDGLLEKIAAGR